MIIDQTDFTVDSEESLFTRIIRRYDVRGEVYYTDTYYQLSDTDEYGERTATLNFCIIRNMTQWDGHRPHGYKRIIHPLSGPKLIVGQADRGHALFRKDNASDSYVIARTFPTESYHATHLDIPCRDFLHERRYLHGDAQSQLSNAPVQLLPYLDRSELLEVNDSMLVFVGSIFAEDCGCCRSYPIWSIAEEFLNQERHREEGEDNHTDELILDCANDALDSELYLQLHHTGFFLRLKQDPETTKRHPDDGIHYYTVNGRYAVVQYINHYHNEFRREIIDLFRVYLANRNHYHGVKSHYSHAFEEMADYLLGEEYVL